MFTSKHTLCRLSTAVMLGVSLVTALLLGLLHIEAAASNTALHPANQVPIESFSRMIPTEYAAACDNLADPMEGKLCQFATSFYPEGLLTNWSSDHAPMFVYTDTVSQTAISESASMLALYAALIGDQTTFDYIFDVSAPAEIGGTGVLMSNTQESPYYFASPNLCLPHWTLDKDGHKDDLGTSWLASAGGEANRWLEALAIAEQKFSDPKYRLFANCLAWGMMGATDFDPRAVGHFEDPGTPEAFDDYLMRPRFGWRDDFSDFYLGEFSNLSYNNMRGWLYAAHLGQESYPLYQTADGAGGIVTVTVPLQAIGSIRIDLTERGTPWGYSLYEIEAHSPFTDTNLLLNADCASSSYQDDPNCQACTCEKVLDGIISESSRWASNWADDEWLVISPTQPSRVMTITLYWESAYASSYSLSASWPFADFYNNVLNCTAPVMAGSIQQCGTDLPRVMYDVGRHAYYTEILVSNLVCTTMVTATASSTENTYVPDQAIDCNPNTRWSSLFTDDQWLALEFNQPITIDTVSLKWETAYGQRYTIDVSDDGVSWTTVYTEVNGNGGEDVIHFPLTTTRYLRMHGLSRGTEFGYSLWEFEVYERGGTSSLSALDLARRAGAYAKLSGDAALWEMGQRILAWYKAEYTAHISSTPTIAAYYDPCTGNRLDEQGDWSSIMADLAELAAEYCDCDFAQRVVEEKLRPAFDTNPDIPFNGSTFDVLEVLLALRRVTEHCPCLYLPIVLKNG